MCNSFKKLWAATIAALAISVGISNAQALRTITGVVVDETNLGIPGAYVVVKNETRGSITDVEGKFSLDVKTGDVLQVTFLGYQDQEVKVGDQKTLTIKMVPSEDLLDEVTFVAYGAQRKASVIGSISTIKADALASPAGQLSSGLAGKLAGIVSLQRTGEPGAGSDFWIRGVNTFGANAKPLILVDGVERSMDLVDTEDIASFSILKDATATALYGVRGANGIVLITTKRGQESKPQVNFKAEYGLTQPVKLPKLANTSQWIDYYNELYVDAGSAPVIDDYQREMYLSGADPDLYPSVDWVDTIFKNMANTEKINVNVTGGTKGVRYYVGASYYMEDGIFNVVKDKDYSKYDNQIRFDKFNFRSNVDIDITKSTTLALSLSTQYYTKTTPGYDLGEIYAYTMYSTPIASPPVFSDGTLSNPDGGWNPYRMLNSSGYKRATNIVAQSLISLTQDFSDIITKGLKANVKYSWDADNGNVLGRLLSPTLYYTIGRDDDGNLIYKPWNEGTNYMYLSKSNSSYTTTNLEASLTYEREFNYAHNVSGLLLFSTRNRYNNVPANFEQSFAYKNMGLAGRATYSYKDRYFGEFNFGYNGSENFAPGKRFGFFPSIAVGYMISNEPFWEPIKETVNLLKFKVSYGKIGNDQIGGSRRFAYNSTINTNAPGFTFGTTPQGMGGITTGEVGNSLVQWEEALKFNAGIELTLLSDLSFQIDYFSDHRSGIFIERQSTPPIVGLNKQQWVNLGEMENKGVDMSIQYEHHFGDLYVSARGNYTFNRNKKLYDDLPDQIWSYQNLTGFAYNQQFGLIAEGLFKDQEDIDNWPKQDFGNVRPGDIKYRDVNGDGIINTFDKVAIGYTTIPEINYGFGVSLGYKGIDFSVFFQGVSHVTRIIGGQNLFGASSQIHKLGQIYEDVALNRWTLENQNPNAPYPRLSLNKVDNNQQPSTYWQRDMSFIRLKNMEIGYTIPKKLTSKIGLSTVRFYAQGMNLLTFSKFKLWDPELDSSYGNVYPTMRTYTFGVNLNF